MTGPSPASRTELSGELTVGGKVVGITGFEGPAGHLFVLFDPDSRPRRPVRDSYHPSADYGHVWIREDGGMWVASGSVNVALIGGHERDIDRILYFIAEELLALDDQLATCVDVVETRVTQIFNGEEGPLTITTAGSRTPASGAG